MIRSSFFMRQITLSMAFLLITSLFCVLVARFWGNNQADDVIAYIGPRPNNEWQDNQFSVNLYDVGTGIIVPITTSNLYPQVFGWSPNGEYIAFIARVYGDVTNPSGLYVMRADGHDAQLISGNLVVIITSERPPYWTDDNRNLIFQGQQLGVNNVQFFRGSLDGKPPELIDLNDVRAQGYIRNLFPSFYISPNGLYQTYVDYQNNEWGLFVIVRGIRQRIHPLTAEEMMPDAPDWSPDSTRIAFSQREQRIPIIWIMSLTGEKLFRIEQGRYPLWKPILP